jgi:hypothetical protein
MTETNYSHDPHIWPITRARRVLTDDKVQAAVVIAEQLLLTGYEEWGEWDKDPHIWPITRPWRVWTDDEIRAAVVITKRLLLTAYYAEWRVSAPPKPKPEPGGDDDISDAT